MWIMLLLLCFPQDGYADDAELNKVILQLRWDHQFQFAGYYAADWKGFYQEHGLDVEIRSGLTRDKKMLSATHEVSQGRAHFGTGGADILIAYDQGADLRVVSVIFQQSASRFYLRQSTRFSSLADLVNLRVARKVNDLIDVELQAMLISEGIDPRRIPAHPHPPGFEHLLSDKVQVMPGYKTSVPYEADKAGVRLKEITPVTYGIDFYGDTLFTRGDIVSQFPDLVTRFSAASLRGWEYALEHPREISKEIVQRLKRLRTHKIDDFLGFNDFQADIVRELTLYPIVQLGHTNPFRWEKMYQFLKNMGLAKQELHLDTFVFDPRKRQEEKEQKIQKVLKWGVILTGVVLLLMFVWVFSLRELVNQRTLELQESETRFKIALKHSKIIVFHQDHALRYTWVHNPYPGFKNEDILGRTDEDLVPPEDAARLTEMKQRVLTTGVGTRGDVRTLIRGQAFFYDLIVEPLYSEIGEIIGVTCASMDITDRKHSQDALEKRTQELERINRELEQFTYVSSHDLQEPLRTVTSYVQLLERRYKGKLDPGADQFIAFAVDGAVRMKTLIDDLLAFSRVGTREEPLRPVETAHVLTKAVANLGMAGERGAVVSHDPLPVVWADCSQLIEVFQNLISNAMKFCRERPPRIHISAENKEGEWIFSFEDNGIGIAPEYHDRVFVIFQRLHTRDKYPGTGMGLAICKKVVERHRGRIWVESREGAGSVFYFTIPGGDIL